jgi:hypothetical protein
LESVELPLFETPVVAVPATPPPPSVTVPESAAPAPARPRQSAVSRPGREARRENQGDAINSSWAATPSTSNTSWTSSNRRRAPGADRERRGGPEHRTRRDRGA